MTPSAVPGTGALRPRRGGRPTLQETERLDWAVRECALQLFLEHGYEGTSMDAIACAAATTKASLYTRFASKQDVFSTVLKWAIQRPDWPSPEPDLPDVDDLEAALTAIADAAVRKATNPAMVKLGRIAMAQAARFPDIAHWTHLAALSPRHQLVIDLLSRHAEAGKIVVADPEILAEHFFALVTGMPARLASFGITRDPAQQKRRTEIAVQFFLRGLRPG